METGKILLGDAVWAARAERAVGAFERMRGLLGRRALGAGAALLIERCGAVHTVGMRFPLDLVFVDRSWQVVRVVRNVRPGRLMVWGGWRAARVVESEAGCLGLDGVSAGVRLVWSQP
jgi:uncharacterized membrane protein (UPF0127 family)